MIGQRDKTVCLGLQQDKPSRKRRVAMSPTDRMPPMPSPLTDALHMPNTWAC